MYSSMSNGSRKPPGRLRILEKVSKSTAVLPLVEVYVWVGKRWGERTVRAYTALEIADLSERGVLPTCAQEVAEGAAVDAPVAALVEELEGFAVVGGGLGVVIHCCSLVVVLKSSV